MTQVRPAIPFSEAITGRDGRGRAQQKSFTRPSILFFRIRIFGGFCRAQQKISEKRITQ